ncbi:MAG: amidohydrolase [Saprospiraceae bacterium]|nr:amidohydrolase [Saprospiraceae bacterium]
MKCITIVPICRINLFALMLCCLWPIGSQTQTLTLQDIGASYAGLPKVTIYTAKEIVTLDENRPTARAVAIQGDRILAVGDLESLKKAIGDQPYRIDERFAGHVIVPGFIAQHDHPVLAALTMVSEVLSIEDWDLPSGKTPAVKDRNDFFQRLTAADKRMADPVSPLVSWGYHPYFYGNLTRADLDKISTTRPIIIWHRSCHQVTLNSAALKANGISRELVAGWGATPKEQSNLEEGNFYEQGMFAVLPKIVGMMVTPEKLEQGLYITRDYMHTKGLTLGCEPGGILVKPLQDAVNQVMSPASMPFRFYFIADGKTLVDKYTDDAQVLAEAEKLDSWYEGMTGLLPKQIKLFADGAIYSQLMQVRDPYLDGHKGEWMTDLGVFERAFRIFWDAGYQIHVHVNGDAGMDRVLNTLEANMRRRPRYDHRTVLVHFAVSAPDQVERIKQLGCIVSANPYYVTALADKYGEKGLGPKRADDMVRLGDVERAGVSYSFHSDMPMAPADPLFLIWCAVNRKTPSGRVAAPAQRVSREGALRAMTLDAAYSLRLEHEVGSIEPGKKANFTILKDNPVTCDPDQIRNIKVWGTVMEGRLLPVGGTNTSGSTGYRTPGTPEDDVRLAQIALEHALKVAHAHE